MADLVGKLGQTIKGSVSGFGAGFKQAAIGGNPALFGAALGTMEKAFSKKFDEDKKERTKDREERRRDRQFNEEKENEQRKVDSDILKSLRSIEKLMEALLGKKGDKEGGFFAALLGNFRKLLGPLLAGLTAFLASLDDVLSDILKAFSGWAKKLAGKGLGIIDDLLKAFNNFFRNIFDKIKSLKIGAFVDDLLQNFKNFFKGLFDRFKATSFGKFIDEALKSVKGFFTNLFTQISKLGSFFETIGKNIDEGFKALKAGRIAELIGEIGTKIKSFFGSFFDDIAKKVPKIFDVEVDLFKRLKDVFKAAFFEGRLIQSLDDLAEVFSSKGVLGKFAATLGLVFETLKTGVVDKVGDVFSKMGDFFKGIAELPIVAKIIELGGEGLKKIFKAIPIIGNLIMVIEGIFEAFDTESLADSLQKAQKDIGFGDRVVGFLGGLIGSIFGILDLIPMAIKALFGIDMAFEDGETIQKKATRLITGFIGDFFGYFSGLFTFIGGLLTFDSVLMKKGLLEMELIVEDWLFGFKNFFGGIIKVPFAKMTNTVAGAIEYMVNGIIGAINDFVAFVLDKLAVIPGAGGLAGRAKEALRVEKVTIGRMDESPYKPQQSRRRVAAEKIKELEKTEAAEAQSKKAAASASYGSSAATAGGAGKLTSEAQYALDYFMNAGFTPAQAAGLVANLQAESGASLNTKAVGDAGTAFGIAQWRGDRAARFKSMYGKDVVNSSLDEQLSYVLWELSNTEKTAGAKLRNAKTEAEAAAIVDQYYERSSGAHRDRRVAGAGMLLASYKPSSGTGAGTSTPVANEVLGFARTPEDKQKITDAIVDYREQRRSSTEKEAQNQVTDAITILPNQNNEQIALMEVDAQRQVQYRQEDNKYRIERDALQKRFHDTLKRGYENILTGMAGPGGFGGTAEGGARSAVEKAVGPAFEKLGTKIFGKEMGGEIGQIFTQLTGSYTDQIATQILGPMFFGGDTGQANRFFNSLASGNKKNAMEDLIYGMTGAATGFRSAVGYEQGAAQIAQELATLTGTPFDPLFHLDKEQKIAMEQAQATAAPVVDAIHHLGDRILSPQTIPGGGGRVTTSSGDVVAASQGIYGPGGYVGTPGYGGGRGGPGGGTGMPATVNALANMGALFLGQKLGVDTRTFGGSIAQAGLGTAMNAGLSGGNILQALTSMNSVSNMGRSIAIAGGNMFAKGVEGGVQQMIGSQMASFGGGMSLGSSGGFQNMGNFGSMNTAGQAGYVAGVIGSALTAKSVSDAFSGGYKSGVGDAVAVIGSFFDPTGGFIAGTVGAIVNRLFGRKAPEVTDSGITGTLGIKSSSLRQYTDILEKGGTYRSDKRYTNYADLDPKVAKAIQGSIGALTDGIKSAGKALGLDRRPERPSSLDNRGGFFPRLFKKRTDEEQFYFNQLEYYNAFQKLLKGEFTQDVKVSLKGKSDEEIQEIMTKMIEDFADAYIRDAFGDTLDQFAREGEKLFETFDRLTQSSIAMSDIALKLRYNFNLLNLSLDTFKSADLASTFLDLAGGVEEYAKNIQFYFESFYTAEEQLEYASEKGRQLMQATLERAGLNTAMSVEGLTNMMGESFEDARKAYRKVVEDFIAANGGMEEIVKKGDPEVIERLAALQGQLAQEYYATTKAIQELDRIKGTSKEALTNAARALFDADIAAAGRAFAVGGVASGPRSGYAALLHGTEAVVPLPNSREIPVELRMPLGEGGVGSRTFVNNIIGNGNATVSSTPTNVISATPMATSGSSANRVLTPAF
jgi:hypothetical protein